MKEKRSGSAEFFYDTFESPIGILYLVFSGKTLTKIDFEKPVDISRKDVKALPVKKELGEYFEDGRNDFTQKIDPADGTEFEKKVWFALQKIPFGETRTYKWLAERVGSPNAARAVGQALSKNPLPVILPCHRIIESDGSLGGYSGGIDIKRRLLEMEYYMKMAKKDHPLTGSG